MSVDKTGSAPVPEVNEQRDLLKEIKALKDSLNEKTVEELNALDITLEPKKMLEELIPLVQTEIANSSINEVDLRIAIFQTAAGDKLVAEWIAQQLGLDFKKLMSENEGLGQDDLLKEEPKVANKEEVVENKEGESDVEGEDSEEAQGEDLSEEAGEEVEPEAEALPASLVISKNLGSNQIRFLDAVKGLPGNPKSIEDIATLIAEQVSQSREEAAQAAADAAEPGSQSGGIMGGLKGLADRFSKKGDSSIVEVVSLLGIKGKDLPDGSEGVKQLLEKKINDMFSDPEDEAALTTYLERSDASGIPHDVEEQNLQKSLRESVSDWAQGSPFAQKYEKYLEKGGLLEFSDWASDNVPALAMLFGQLSSMFKGLKSSLAGIFPAMAPDPADTPPTLAEKYQTEIDKVATERSNKAEADARTAEWKEEDNVTLREDIAKYNRVMPGFVTFDTTDIPTVTPGQYKKELLEAKIGTGNEALKKEALLDWGVAVNSDESGQLNNSVVAFGPEVEAYLQKHSCKIEDETLTIDINGEDEVGGEKPFTDMAALNEFVEIESDTTLKDRLVASLQEKYADGKEAIAGLSTYALTQLDWLKGKGEDLKDKGEEWFTDKNIKERAENWFEGKQELITELVTDAGSALNNAQAKLEDLSEDSLRTLKEMKDEGFEFVADSVDLLTDTEIVEKANEFFNGIKPEDLGVFKPYATKFHMKYKAFPQGFPSVDEGNIDTFKRFLNLPDNLWGKYKLMDKHVKNLNTFIGTRDENTGTPKFTLKDNTDKISISVVKNKNGQSGGSFDSMRAFFVWLEDESGINAV